MENNVTEQTEEAPPRLTCDEKAKRVDDALDRFEESVGLPAKFGNAVEVENEALRLLEMDRTTLSKMSAEDCAIGSWTLLQFAFHLQRAMNKEQTRVTWADESVKRLINPIVSTVKAYSWEERRAKCISLIDAAPMYEQKRVNAKLRLERLSFLSNKVEGLARCLMNLKYKKHNNREDD